MCVANDQRAGAGHARRRWPDRSRTPAPARCPRELVHNGTRKTYEGFPHRMPTIEAETINADLLAFLQS